jgi:hypothetical protein
MRTKPFLSIPQFPRMGGLSVKVARRLVLDGKVPSKLIGAQRRIRTEWVERWLSESDARTTYLEDDRSRKGKKATCLHSQYNRIPHDSTYPQTCWKALLVPRLNSAPAELSLTRNGCGRELNSWSS